MRCVGDVERLATELEAEAIGEVEVLGERDVSMMCAVGAQLGGEAGSGAKSAGSGGGGSAGVEPELGGAIVDGKSREAGNTGILNREAVGGKRVGGFETQWKTGGEAESGGEVPTAEEGIGGFRQGGGVFTATADGDLIDDGGDEALGNVVSADGVVEAAVVEIAEALVDNPARVFAGVVRGAGQLVAGQQGEAI